MEEVEIVKLSEASVHLLRQVIGKRLYSLYTEHIKVEASGKETLYWAAEYALGLTANKSDASFINISADYKLTSKSSTTYYGFEIEESKTPLRKEKLLQSGQYSEVKVKAAPVLMIEIYQDWNQEFDEVIFFDAAIVFYTNETKFLMKVREELIGGVDIIVHEQIIETYLKDLKLRQSII
jgi:hypothetical protein